MRTAGTNCDRETAFAFTRAGGRVAVVHINRFLDGQARLEGYQILALPGGFSYGDDIASGKLFANELRYKLIEQVKEFIREGKLVIGVCNGFQILVKAGILPGNGAWAQEASLIINDSGKFEDRWVYLRNQNPALRLRAVPEPRDGKCVWTKGLPEIMYLPVAHGEGKFVVRDSTVLQRMKRNGQIVLWYCDETGREAGYPGNPNGSVEDIAGICDETGRVFGLMPHPERHISVSQHPRWQRSSGMRDGDGLMIFKNAIEYAARHR